MTVAVQVINDHDLDSLTALVAIEDKDVKKEWPDGESPEPLLTATTEPTKYYLCTLCEKLNLRLLQTRGRISREMIEVHILAKYATVFVFTIS